MAERKISRRKFLQQGLAGVSVVLISGCASPRLDLKTEMARLDQNPKTRATHQSYMDAYGFDRCIECGECLHSCLYKDLTADEAAENIRQMRAGNVAVCEPMLDQCVFCYNCNYACPVDANPAALMLERLRDRRNREGTVPASMRYMINGMESQGWEDNLFGIFIRITMTKKKPSSRNGPNPKTAVTATCSSAIAPVGYSPMISPIRMSCPVCRSSAVLRTVAGFRHCGAGSLMSAGLWPAIWLKGFPNAGLTDW